MTKNDHDQITLERHDFVTLISIMGMMSSLIGLVFADPDDLDMSTPEADQMLEASNVLITLMEKYGTEQDMQAMRDCAERAFAAMADETERPN